MMENRRSSSLLKWCVYINNAFVVSSVVEILWRLFFFFTHVCRQEKMYSNWFCDGDVLEAQAQMLSKRGDALLMDWTQLRLGYRLGMCTILAMWVAWDSTWGQIALGQVSIGGRSAFPVFRACFGLLSWHWFWGMSVYIWTRYRINYLLTRFQAKSWYFSGNLVTSIFRISCLILHAAAKVSVIE